MAGISHTICKAKEDTEYRQPDRSYSNVPNVLLMHEQAFVMLNTLTQLPWKQIWLAGCARAGGKGSEVAPIRTFFFKQ